jgi:hypothetical protein
MKPNDQSRMRDSSNPLKSGFTSSSPENGGGQFPIRPLRRFVGHEAAQVVLSFWRVKVICSVHNTGLDEQSSLLDRTSRTDIDGTCLRYVMSLTPLVLVLTAE